MQDRIIFESANLVVINYSDSLQKHRNYPKGFTNRTAYRKRYLSSITEVIYHQTAGNTLDPPDGLLASNRYVITDPPRKPNGKLDYTRGRGWPKLPYHIYVPYKPKTFYHDEPWGLGRWIIYQCNPFDLITWHTKGANENGVGVVFQGMFSPTKHGKKHPSQDQMSIAYYLWAEYLKPILHLNDKDLKGHFDYTKPNCPGYELQDFVRRIRGENIG